MVCTTLSARATVLLATLVFLTGACGRPRLPSAPGPSEDACVAWSGSATGIDSATVVVTWAVDASHVARPTNAGERFVFAHAYEPLVYTDCVGRLTRGLAQSWAVADGRVRLVLDDSARFWNGDRVTARDVVAAWAATAQETWAVLARHVVHRAIAVDDRTVEIDCLGPGVPRTAPGSCVSLQSLGDPELGVARRVAATPWPEGTGAYRPRSVEAPSPAGAAQRLVLVLEPTGTTARPSIAVHAVGGADARDLVDRGVDLLLTEDPALAAYAATRAELAALPLGWNRTWMLLTPAPRLLDADSAVARTVALRSALARDAVRAEARAAEWPAWWSDVASCASVPAREVGTTTRANARVVANRDEPIARSLAERLVALAASSLTDGRDSSLALLAPQLRPGGGPVAAIALPPNDFAAALRAGSGAGFVVPLARRSLTPCIEVERLRTMVPWVGSDSMPLAMSSRAAPLIDTRLLAVVRRNWLALTMTWDSTIVTSPP